MDINAVNILIILIGIALCFFGIYFKRVAEIIIGFAWGAFFAYLFILWLSVESVLREGDEAIAILIVLALGILMAVLAIKLERLLVTIQGIMLSLLISLAIFGTLLGENGMIVAIIVSLIICAVMGYLLWMYYRYAFICETAIIGSIMINHVWLFGAEELNVFSVILTIIVAAAGIKVQSMWLKKMEGKTVGRGIDTENKIDFKTRTSAQMPSISGLFSHGDVQKAGMTNLCTYEKWLVLIPVITFFIDKIASIYLYNISELTMNFFDSTWEMRNYLMIILEGAFVGCVIYFVIYYEFKVSAIFQLFYLLWLPIEISVFIRYSFVDLGYCLRMVLGYYIPWLIFLGLDRVLHSEMLKVLMMIIISIIWFPVINDWLLYTGELYIAVDIFYFLRWIGIAGTALLLVWMRKSRNS